MNKSKNTKKERFEKLKKGKIELPPDGAAKDRTVKEATFASVASVASEKDGKDGKKTAYLSISDFEHIKKVANQAKKDPDRTVDTVANQLDEIDNIPTELSRPLIKEIFNRKIPKAKTTSDKLMRILDDIEFCSDRAGTGWAAIEGEYMPVRSTKFKRHLQRGYFLQHDKTPNQQATQDVIDQATGLALFDGEVRDIHMRTAQENGEIVVDHFDDKITINAAGWRKGADICFYRPQGLNELPMPQKSKDGIQKLKKYLNFDDDSDFRLMVAWLLTAFKTDVSCPILNFQGEQGSAKTTNSKVLRNLVDPSGAMLNPAPRSERDLVIQAQNSRVLCLDNLSGLKKWLSDALCRICTGTGFSTRKLRTDDEQQIFQVKRPIILNGIDDIATRGDLLDRSIVFNLPSIPPEDRKEEREFWAEFFDDRPAIISGLYDALAAGLGASKPKIPELPRMADFAEWVTRCETGLPWDAGELLDDYNINKDNAIEAGLDGDYLGVAIRKILDQNGGHYSDTPTALVNKMREVSPESSEKYLPTTRTLAGKLRRLGPALRKVGITWDYDPSGDARTYTIDRSEKVASVASGNDAENENLPF
jgi:hypothetical protein